MRSFAATLFSFCLFAGAAGRFTLLSTGDLAEPLVNKYGSMYAKASIGRNVYGAWWHVVDAGS